MIEEEAARAAAGEAQEEVVAEGDPAAVVILHQAGLWAAAAITEFLAPTKEVTALLYREGLFPERDLEDQWEEAGSRTVPHTRRLHLRRWQGDGCARIIQYRLGFSSIS